MSHFCTLVPVSANKAREAAYDKAHRVFVVESWSGKALLVCHASEEGHIGVTALRILSSGRQIDGVCCCYPKAVKALHPSLPIVGDWNGPTSTWINPEGKFEWGPSNLIDGRFKATFP